MPATRSGKLTVKGKVLPRGVTRTVSGAQLSSSGAHLSVTGSGVRNLFEKPAQPVVAVVFENAGERISAVKTARRALTRNA